MTFDPTPEELGIMIKMLEDLRREKTQRTIVITDELAQALRFLNLLLAFHCTNYGWTQLRRQWKLVADLIDPDRKLVWCDAPSHT